jgi:hypothetical protein
MMSKVVQCKRARCIMSTMLLPSRFALGKVTLHWRSLPARLCLMREFLGEEPSIEPFIDFMWVSGFGASRVHRIADIVV